MVLVDGRPACCCSSRTLVKRSSRILVECSSATVDDEAVLARCCSSSTLVEKEALARCCSSTTVVDKEALTHCCRKMFDDATLAAAPLAQARALAAASTLDDDDAALAVEGDEQICCLKLLSRN